jgi:hypothetical protein
MNWVTIFIYWEFWVAMTLVSVVSGMFGFLMYAIVVVNKEQSEDPCTFGELSLALANEKENNQRYKDQIAELCRERSDLQRQLKARYADL